MVNLTAIEGALGSLEMKHRQSAIRVGKRGLEVLSSFSRFLAWLEIFWSSPRPVHWRGALLLGSIEQRGHGHDHQRCRYQCGRTGLHGIAPAPHPESRSRPTRRAGDRHAGQPAIQILGERIGASVAAARVFLQALQTNDFQIPRHAGLSFRGDSGDRSRTCSSVSMTVVPPKGALPVRSA